MGGVGDEDTDREHREQADAALTALQPKSGDELEEEEGDNILSCLTRGVATGIATFYPVLARGGTTRMGNGEGEGESESERAAMRATAR